MDRLLVKVAFQLHPYPRLNLICGSDLTGHFLADIDIFNGLPESFIDQMGLRKRDSVVNQSLLTLLASHRFVINFRGYESSQVSYPFDELEASTRFDPGSLRQLVPLGESLSHVPQHTDFITNLRRYICNRILLSEGNGRGLEHSLVKLVQLVLLRIFDSSLDVKRQKFYFFVDGFWLYRFAFRG